MISSYSIRTINITNMFRAKTALVTVLVLLSCVSMQAQKADQVQNPVLKIVNANK